MEYQSLINEYRTLRDLREKKEEIVAREKLFFESAAARGLLTQQAVNLELAIMQYEQHLKITLGQLIESSMFREAGEVLSVLNNESLPQRTTVQRKEVPVKEAVSFSFTSPIAEEVYEKAESFYDLLDRSRRLRNAENQQQKITWARLLGYVDICQTYLRNIRQGKTPSDDIARKFAEALGGDQKRFVQIAQRYRVDKRKRPRP